jgi:hypothetical protein
MTRAPTSTMLGRGIFAGVFLALLAWLVRYSAHLAAVRIYQVDECQNVYMARVLASGQASEFFTNASLFLLGPLSWIAKNCHRSEDLFSSARLLFLGVFWVNIFLLTRNACERLLSIRGAITLTAAATLAPLWDYGFEIRHDNLILTGILLTWWTVRVKPMGARSYVIAGGIAVALLFIAVKAVVYVLPLSLAILVFPPPAHGRPRWQLALAWVGGSLLATAVIRICYGTGGMWDLYLSVFHGVTKYSAGSGGASARFGPWSALERLLGQTPLLLALTAVAACAIAGEIWRGGRKSLTWEGKLPEALLLLGALVALAANPTPYPYNLLHVVPYAFLMVAKYAVGLGQEVEHRPNLWPLVGSIFVFAHLVPFSLALQRNVDYTNFRQGSLMSLAEDLTDPVKDPVYDGIGMVPTRRTIHFQWYLHSLNIQSFINGSGPRVRDMLAARPAAVFIPSYRTDVLPRLDHEFISEHYVSLADDFWVLGNILPIGGGTFEIVHPGRYRIASLQASDLAGTYPAGYEGLLTPEAEGRITGTLDGAPLSNHVVSLAVGSHRIETADGVQPAILWLGPRRDRLHRLSPSAHETLFVNWY